MLKGEEAMETIITGAITAAVTLLVCLINNHYQHKEMVTLITYRLQELEKKVDKHNNLVERMYACEEADKLQEAEFKRINHRLESLEGGKTA